MSELPGKIGAPTRSSAKTQPSDHVSEGDPYAGSPKMVSGDLYQRAHRVLLITSPPTAKERAIPKSASLTTPSLVTKIFREFKSYCLRSISTRCSMRLECT
eukprot:TRINITY_DN10814_c0_g1_i11.p1 TRINITY_DN10814_c0_g1~~TRINITY_DN10814_c0_g1_i11.p1  ORF type:complete len:101 (-),score=4.43 TRINITY_DN10814_c0_g1_i11:265-567(-)